MPRTHLPGASTLRNRNRITNKTRLKIIKGNVDADDLFIPDEDEEKHRLTNLVAGVDAEDANEVLSAAHKVTKKTEEKPAAFIPTPDSTGTVDNADELYPPNKWRDPATYACTSSIVEEHITNGIANGFTYYMDERDKEWLDKNNEEARGEGTSAQGAVSASGSNIRTSARSAKSKGKEPDVNQPTAVSEDEFELVMGLFEKITHEKTEFLHHSLETGMPFPAFTDYQDVFSSPLTPATFASYTVPTWIPQPQKLLRIARTVYPYWKERRIERAGHRIIPILNFDESDTLNESYICFRRREIKAVRKTRQTQVTFSDKLVRLQTEFVYPLELAKLVLQREMAKKEQAQNGQEVWQKRLELVDLKRKYPAFQDKLDEEVLVDKERPKKPEIRLPPRPPRPQDGPIFTPIPQIVIKPRERIAQVKAQTEAILAKQKEADRSWEDVIDNPFQTPHVPHACRLFQYVPPPDAPSWPAPASDKTSDSEDERPAKVARYTRAIRLRYGRGGRLVLDRRDHGGLPPTISKAARSSLFGGGDDNTEDMEVDHPDPEEEDRLQRLQARWKFDSDDSPPCGPGGMEEQDRVLIDDYDPKYLRHAMTLFKEVDHTDLATDPTLHLPNANGQQTSVLPYRLGMPPMIRRDPQGQFRPVGPMFFGMPPGSLPHPAGMQQVGMAGTPVSMLKKMPPPNAIPQMRISNGGMRLSNIPMQQQTSPPHPSTIPSSSQSSTSTPNAVQSRPAIAMPHVDLVKPSEPGPLVNGITPSNTQATETATTQSQEATVNGITPPRPKSQNQTPVALGVPTNGYHLTSLNPAMPNITSYVQLSAQRTPLAAMQKMQEFKTALANLPPQEQIAALAAQAGNRALAANFLQVNGNGQQQQQQQLPTGNINLKLPAARPMQWAAMGAAVQRPASAMNGVGEHLNGIGSPSMIPVRSPSANGIRPGMRIGSNGQLQMSPHLQQPTASPMPNISQSQSPPRLSMTPTLTMASPPQQAVGSNQNGY
ncbi:hypothetical protein FA15DRAFT_597418 [Coprinopsis marcescibilis]|uniref:Enhancer of polycomb-like protein n=1 Tax=Coprinopsis marcescibilis TaxID=230819 RepID=A0A5C3KNB0_COPMA|nr:hypothetical protein FA15DRAFT_597418 [Coprinopsis marcescibilis]